MPYFLVVLVATVAGGAVAAYTVLHDGAAEASPETWTKGYEEPVEEATDAPGQRRRPLPSAPTWQTRLTGIVGLLIAVLIGAGLIVGACLVVWNTLRRATGH